MKRYCEVDWEEYNEDKDYEEGFYFVAIPINPIEGCVTRIVRFNGKRWYDRYNYPINKHARDEWVAIADVTYPHDYSLNWKEKFPEFFKQG